jgi:hypothetical protein
VQHFESNSSITLVSRVKCSGRTVERTVICAAASMFIAVIGLFGIDAPMRPTSAQANASTPVQPKVIDDRVERQAWGIRTMRMFMTQEFAQLDSQFEVFRNEELRWPSGLLKSQYGFDAIRFSVKHDQQRPDNSYDIFRQVSAEWVRQRDASPAARVAHAIVLREFAAQGMFRAGFDRRAPDGKAIFVQRLREAHSYLIQSKDVAAVEPQWYAELILNAADLGENAAAISAYFREGVARFPNYDPIYTAMATASLPAKGGSIEAMQAVVAAAEALPAADHRAIVLGRVLIHFYDSFDRRIFNAVIPWESVKPAMQGLMQAHPTRLVMHKVAQIACQAGDHSVGQVAFGALDLITIQEIEEWPSRQELARCLSAAFLPSFKTVLR